MHGHGRLGLTILVPVLLLTGVAGQESAAAAAPPRTLAELDRDFAATAAGLERRATAAGHTELATAVSDWRLPAEEGVQIVLAIPPSGDAPPDFIDTESERAIWEQFLDARRRRAAGTFALAVAATLPPAAGRRANEAATPGAAPPPAGSLPRTAEAIRLLYRTLWDDPGHERAREAGGWVRRGDSWVWPEVARRLDKREEFSPAFGWLPQGRQKRYAEGERYLHGRWIGAEAALREAATPPRPARGPAADFDRRAWRFATDHWLVTTDASEKAAAELAAGLEECHAAWLQVFGGFQHEPEEWNRRLEGRSRPKPLDPFVAKLTARRDDYVAALEPVEPSIARTLGIYWTPTRTAWFFEGDGQARATVHHEAVHQLFAEKRRTSPLAGERCGFWAIEAAACYMESLAPAAFGWTVGGREAGRVPAARERLLDDGFHVPLEELCGMGRRELQADERLPMIYSQISGLADFFMNGERGRHRDAFVEYLVRIYTGTVDPDTLARLCGVGYAELDDAYRRHMAR